MVLHSSITWDELWYEYKLKFLKTSKFMISKYIKFHCQLNFALNKYISKVQGKDKNIVISWIKKTFKLFGVGIYRNC